MTHPNEAIINRFFQAYMQRDFAGVREVMAEDVVWTFAGRHPLAGVKKGIDEVIAFFDTMGGIMSKSHPSVNKLIVASNEIYSIECQRIQTNRPDGINIDHYVTVLWTFEDGKIVSGRHFFADPQAVDNYFTQVSAKELNKK